MTAGSDWPNIAVSGLGRWLARYSTDLGVEFAYLCQLRNGTIAQCTDQTGTVIALPLALSPLVARIQERGSLVMVDDLTSDSLIGEDTIQPLSGAFLGVGVCNELGALVGMLLAYGLAPRSWTNQDLERAGDAAQGIASLLIIDELRLHAESRVAAETKARELRQQMHVISAQAASAASLPELSRILSKQIPSLLGAEWAVVAVRDPESTWQVYVPPERAEQFEAIFDGPDAPGDVLLDYAAGLEKETQELTAELLPAWPAIRNRLAGDRPLQVLATSLSLSSELSMVLLAGSVEGAADLRAAYAFEELLEDARRAVERTADAQRQIQAAATLQRSLLPPRIPDLPGYEIGRLYSSAADHTRVGGDWFDIVEIDSTTTGFVVGDVAGHDIRSAAIMGQLRHVLASQLRDRRRPASALAATDRYFADLAENVMATAVVIVIDRATECVHVALAGHPPPVRLAAGRATLVPAHAGPPIGFGYGGHHDLTQPIAPNEILIAYTDGVVESRNVDLAVALERFVAELEAAATTSVQELLRVLDRRSTMGELVDDVAALVVRIEPVE